MKLVIHCYWGGFSLPPEFCETYDIDTQNADIERDDLRLIQWVQEHADSHLTCVEIPDNCTDYEVNDYDGWESVIYVVDGKIHHSYDTYAES